MSIDSEKREFIRVKVSVPVRFKFLAHGMDEHPEMQKVHEGTTSNLSGGGILLRARIPDLDWLAGLLSGRIQIGVNMTLPTYGLPIKALTRVVWIEGLEEETRKASLGLRFREITKEAEDEILRYIIKTQMPLCPPASAGPDATRFSVTLAPAGRIHSGGESWCVAPSFSSSWTVTAGARPTSATRSVPRRPRSSGACGTGAGWRRSGPAGSTSGFRTA